MAERPMRTASSGLEPLDDVLGGMFWGDNVVWELEHGASHAPFFRAIAQETDGYHFAGYVTLGTPPADIRAMYPAFEVIDGRPGAEHAQPGALMSEIRRRCRRFERDVLLFDPLDRMVELWGAETARRFYTRCCPLLLDLGAVAYWCMSSSGPARVRKTLNEVAQCVITVGHDRLRVVKAEGRPPRVEGTVMRYGLEDGTPVLHDAPAAARLGAALRAVRSERSLTQTELGRMAGISSSAVSQAERGQRGLAFETLLALTSGLGISLDDLMRGQVSPGYRLARRHDPERRGDSTPLPLLDDPRAGLRAYLVRLQPGASAAPAFAHKGPEMVAVATGLVQVSLSTGLPVLRDGEVIIVDDATIGGWRNLGEHEATFFWIVRDDRPDRG